LKTNNHIDIELVKAYQAGDQKAIAGLVKRWHLTFCKKAYWMVKDADLSKDIAQESWQIIIRKLYTLKQPSSFKSWALRIVYSKSIDALRRQNKKHLREIDLNSSHVVQSNDDKEDNVELKQALLKAVNCLPDQQQNVIKLFYTEEYSLKEISKLLNISVGTAKSRLFHAREKIKQTLKNKNYEN
jgi:RNA polymerase sigma-70 factor (ECF subfamily)